MTLTRSQRRLFIDTGLLGALLTVLVVALDLAGALAPLERFFYDLRARHCQFFTPPPTDKLVHLDIDDRSLESIGRWPWPRSALAEIVDELALAGCRTICFDVIFPEAEGLAFEELPSTQPSSIPATAPATAPADTLVHGRYVNNDDILSESLKRFGRAVVPVSLTLGAAQTPSPVYRLAVSELYARPDLSVDDLIRRVQAKSPKDKDVAAEVRSSFITARREAIYERVDDEVARGALDLDDLRQRLFPKLGLNVGNSPQLSALRQQFDRYRAIQSLRKFSKPLQDGLPPLLASMEEQATIAELTQPAAASGYVDYIPMNDGIVRMMPLVAEHRGHIVPHMGLALACAMMDVPFKDVQLRPDRIIIPKPDGSRVEIPVRSHATSRGRLGMFFDIPWFGTGDWQTMYDYPDRREKSQHVSISFVWEARELLKRIEKNNALADEALLYVLSQLALEKFEQYHAAIPPLHDSDARRALIEWTLRKMQTDGTVEFWSQMDLASAPPEDQILIRKMLESPDALKRILQQNQDLKADIERRRAEIRSYFAGKAALIGYIAVSTVADNVPTSLHARCPGVAVHGVIFNSIMTGDFWRAAPTWVSITVTVTLGLVVTLVAAMLPAWKALFTAALLAAGYVLLNTIYFFDYHNTLFDLAGPLTAIAAVWAGGTFARYLLESRERARVKKRFQNYVDPVLVDHVLETDDRLDGQKKELTVVFTDLQGFTALSEALGEKVVAVLNEYMTLMVPVIRRHRGVLNKFLGDGIMFFYGAPVANEFHAYDAVATLLEMQEVMVEFNKSLAARDLPTLITRAGISSGEMIVGDAGPEDGSDYTVLGDVVNLGARLESANKFFGTRILLNERARQLVGDGRILFRPVGKLQVMGKKEGVMTYEALAPADRATDAQKQLAALTVDMVTAYLNARFDRCTAAVEELERAFGPGKLTDLYRNLCEQNLIATPDEFSGEIILTTK